MEEIIKKAIEGGAFGNFEKVSSFNWYIGNGDEVDLLFFDNGNVGIKMSLHKQFMKAEFWQALGKACGWEEVEMQDEHRELNGKPEWFNNAIRFHEINLTKGFDKAVDYLKELTK